MDIIQELLWIVESYFEFKGISGIEQVQLNTRKLIVEVYKCWEDMKIDWGIEGNGDINIYQILKQSLKDQSIPTSHNPSIFHVLNPNLTISEIPIEFQNLNSTLTKQSTHPIPMLLAKLELENWGTCAHDESGIKKCPPYEDNMLLLQYVAKLKFNGNEFKDIVLTIQQHIITND